MANYTSVTASNICDAAGNKLASGTVSFQATDAANQPLNFQVGGGGQVVTTPATAAITAGAIAGGFQVADSANTSPAGILYRITITDTTLNRVVVTYSLVSVTGTTFSLDNFSQTGAAVLPPVGGSVNGPLTVTGDLSVTGSILTDITSKRVESIRFAAAFAVGSTTGGIQEAINDLGVGGGIVILPLGTTVCSGILVPSNVTLQGHGMNSSILQMPANSAAGAFVIANSTQSGSGNSRLRFKDFTIDANKANQTNKGQMGFKLDHASFSQITQVEVKNATGLAASAIQWLTSGDNTVNTDNEISFCYLHDNGDIVNNADAAAIGGVRLRFVNNICMNNGDSGVGLQGFGTSIVLIANNVFIGNLSVVGPAAGPGANTFVTVTGNTIITTNGTGYGAYFSGVTGLTFSGNYVSTVATTGTPEAVHVENCTDTTVTANTINGGYYGVGVLATGTSVCSGTTVTGNTIRGARRDGVHIDSQAAGAKVNNTVVSGNNIRNNSQATPNTDSAVGIYQTGITKNTIVSDNFLGDDQLSATQAFGVAVGGAPTLLAMGGNICSGNASGAASGIPADAHLWPSLTGNASSATSQIDSLTLGDGVNMPNSSSRPMLVWGRDGSGNFRHGLIQNTTGLTFVFGFSDGLGGLLVDLNAGKVGLTAEGSNQPIQLIPTGTASVECNTNLLVKTAAPTVAAGQFGLGSTHATTVGAAGGATAPPATPLGYLIANVDGTQVKIPYYNN